MNAVTTTAPNTTEATLATTPHPFRAALHSGAVAAIATTTVAAVATAADVPLEIDGEAIPLVGFAQLTLIAAVLGGLLAVALNRYSTQARTRFVAIAGALTVASCIPSIAFPPDTASKIVLVATHLVAALIIIPAIARQTAR